MYRILFRQIIDFRNRSKVFFFPPNCFTALTQLLINHHAVSEEAEPDQGCLISALNDLYPTKELIQTMRWMQRMNRQLLCTSALRSSPTCQTLSLDWRQIGKCLSSPPSPHGLCPRGRKAFEPRRINTARWQFPLSGSQIVPCSIVFAAAMPSTPAAVITQCIIACRLPPASANYKQGCFAPTTSAINPFFYTNVNFSALTRCIALCFLIHLPKQLSVWRLYSAPNIRLQRES